MEAHRSGSQVAVGIWRWALSCAMASSQRPPEHVLPAQVVGVSVVLRRLPHRQLQQGQVPRPALGEVRVVLQHDLRAGGHLPGLLPVRPPQHLVDRVLPLKHPRRVDLLVEEGGARPPSLVEVPDVGVAQLLRARRPGPLQRLPPPWAEILVQVRTHADVRVRRDQGQGAVAGRVEPPGGDALLFHRHSPVGQLLHRPVLAARVQDADVVCLHHGGHPAVHEFFLIFCDSVHANFHTLSSTWERAGARMPPPVLGQLFRSVSPAGPRR